MCVCVLVIIMLQSVFLNVTDAILFDSFVLTSMKTSKFSSGVCNMEKEDLM